MALAAQNSTASLPRPIYRAVSSVTFEVEGEDAFESLCDAAGRWLKKRNPAIPQEAFKGQEFSIGGNGVQSAQALRTSVENKSIVAYRVDLQDTTHAGRIWITEIVVQDQAGSAIFSATLRNLTTLTDTPFLTTLPGIARQVVQKGRALKDGLYLTDEPMDIESEEDVLEFKRILEDPLRQAPVLAVSAGLRKQALVSATELAARVAGACHVFSLSDEASWELTNSFGKKLSVFDGAVRLYLKGFNHVDADPYSHPLWLSQSEEVDKSRLEAIVAKTLREAHSVDRHSPSLTFAAVRQMCVDSQLKASRDDISHESYSKMLEDEVAQIKADRDRLSGEHSEFVGYYDQELRKVERELAKSIAQVAEIQENLSSLGEKYEDLAAAYKEKIGALPLTSYRDFPIWCRENLSKDIWIADKAMKEMSSAQFREPSRIGDALVVLDQHFVAMKNNPGRDARNRYETELESIRCEDQPCFGDPRSIKSFPEYKVTYEGKEYWCGDHIKHMGGKNPFTYFRIYYFWHEAERKLLIGHMPTHLDNKVTD